jgi:hypothetical protein
MDPTLLMLLAGIVVLILLIILIRRLFKPVDRFDDQDEVEQTASDDGPTGDINLEADKRRKPKSKKSSGACDHHYQMRGFPADKLGTHAIVECSKCGERQVVPVAEAERMMRQRDDVRDAIQRARGDATKR